MSVKRFVAADMRRALELVRQEMGPDAIILSSRRVSQGVEILTTQQPQPQAAAARPADLAVTGTDIPMDSDGAWQHQQALDSALTDNRALQGARLQLAAVPDSAPATAPRGLASGKSPQELAAEIEQARERMLAARRQQPEREPTLEQMARETAPVAPRRRSEGLAAASQPAASVNAARVSGTPQHEVEANWQSQQQQRQLEALQSELADMRLLLEEQLTRMAKTPQLSTPLQSGIMRRLHHMGVSDVLAEQVIARLGRHRTVQEAWADALAVLSRQVPVAGEDWVMDGGVFAFVGPTGVGKTTTIAKLAARYVLEHGAASVALVTTDTYRIAAHDQLRALGRILNVQVKVVDDNQDLPAVLRSLKHCPLVLIDTAGFRLGDTQLREQLQALQTLPSVRTLLVMAANSQLQMMKATVHAHQSVGLAGCVLTKLDESASLGEAMSLMVEQQLPLVYTTDGQEIPQDLALAKGHKLVARAVSMLRSGMGSSGTVPAAEPDRNKQLYL